MSYTVASNQGGTQRLGEIVIGSRTFTVTQRSGSLPVISSFDPPSMTAGSGEFDLTLHGANFETGAEVYWKGQYRATTFLGVTQLRAKIAASDVASPGTADVTVVNPSGGVSAAKLFTITEVMKPVPVISSISPKSRAGGESGAETDGDG